MGPGRKNWHGRHPTSTLTHFTHSRQRCTAANRYMATLEPIIMHTPNASTQATQYGNAGTTSLYSCSRLCPPLSAVFLHLVPQSANTLCDWSLAPILQPQCHTPLQARCRHLIQDQCLPIPSLQAQCTHVPLYRPTGSVSGPRFSASVASHTASPRPEEVRVQVRNKFRASFAVMATMLYGGERHTPLKAVTGLWIPPTNNPHPHPSFHLKHFACWP